MAFIILTTDGEPLADLDGQLILVPTKAEAREWLRPGERVVSWREWVVREEGGISPEVSR